MKSELLSFAVVACVLTITLSAAAEPRPNFLFIYTDDQRWDAMGVVQREQGDQARFPWFTTPNLDRLATEGVRFRNAFVTLSLCSPSRAAFLTGRYNHLNGVPDNFTQFPTNSMTYATQLRAAGYTAAYIGKWHMVNQRGQRPGFDYSASFIGQGQYQNCPFEINGVLTNTTGWVDDVVTDYAIKQLQKLKDCPFAMIVGFKSPHEPWDPPARAAQRFTNVTLRPVANLHLPPPGEPDTEAINFNDSHNLNYFRVISAVDDNLGRILHTLDDLHLATNTVVVFTSDNGFFRGEHGLHDKRYLYDESVRIPFIIRYPKLIQQPRALDDLILNLDLCPTFLELAGVAVPNGVQGRSLVPLLAGRKTDWRQSFLSEYFTELYYPSVPPQYGLRTQTAKLIKYPGHDDWTEMFDLAVDPYETKNLANNPAHREMRAKLETELVAQQRATDFKTPPPTNIKPPPNKTKNLETVD